MRRTTRTRTTILTAAVAAALALGAAPATAAPPVRDLGRAVLSADDGWAAAEGGTTGGAAADASHIFHVDTWAEFQAALGGSGAAAQAAPRIVYVHGELNAFERADGSLATCAAFAAAAGFSQDDYIAAFDPIAWDYTVTPDELAALQAAQNRAATVQARQTQQHVSSNTTIVGVGDTARIVGADLRIRDVDNVIVRNLTLSDSTDCFPEWDPSDTGAGNWNSRYDNISLWTATHVWIDHNTLDSGDLPPSMLETVYGRPYEVHDGLLDITHSSDLVTVSYNVFGEHDKTMLIGSSDGRTADRGTLRVTLHHNHWIDIGQRAPRVRYGQVHAYNNLYSQTRPEGFSYFWGVGREAHLYVENNYLELANGVEPADVVALWTDPATDLQAGMTEIGTVVNRKKLSVLAAYNAAAEPARRILRDAGWEPVLHGRIDPASSLPARVRLQAGAGVLR